MKLLEVEGVSKTFGGVQAVRNVSLDVAAGELVGIMGPNGSGKSTLFNLIAGAFPPDGGRVRVAGEDITGGPSHRACAAGIGRTFQLVRSFGRLSALDHVRLGCLFGRGALRGRAATTSAGRLLALVGLGDRALARPGELTLIDRKRLELARALATTPRVLLLDEFIAGLTPAETEQAIALIRRLQAQGMTILMVEHIVWALMELAGRIAVLSAGEKISEGAPGAVSRDPAVIDVYLGGARARAG